MSDSKNALFTIGQFAALHGINKKTLMWYDQVDLFKPAVVKENGYRYYTYYQSASLGNILTLRELGVSIGEIKSFMENRSADKLELLLGEKIEALDKHIAQLKIIRRNLLSHKAEMQELLNLDLSAIRMIEKETQYLAVVTTPGDTSMEEDIERVIQEVGKHNLPRLYDAGYGSLISAENLYKGNFDNYEGIFIKIPGIRQKKEFHIQPKGTYLQAYCKGNWDKLPSKYEELLKYAQEHNLQFHHYAYETGINEAVIRSMDEYITCIEIPVKTADTKA